MIGYSMLREHWNLIWPVACSSRKGNIDPNKILKTALMGLFKVNNVIGTPEGSFLSMMWKAEKLVIWLTKYEKVILYNYEEWNLKFRTYKLVK